MYVYLYDAFLKEKQYQESMKAIENRLTDFGITGKIIRLHAMSSVRPVIEDEMRRGVKTVVMVGGDETFGHILSSSATLPVSFGFIPVGKKSAVADVLGIPLNAPACDVLSARKIEKLDIGWMNNRFFISQVHIEPAHLAIEYDERFVVQTRDDRTMSITICNLMPFNGAIEGAGGDNVHPQDGRLNAFVQPVEQGFLGRSKLLPASVFPFYEMTVRGRKPFVVVADGKVSREIRLTIKLAEEKLSFIVGKGRTF